MKVLIAPWGSYQSWGTSEYEIGKKVYQDSLLEIIPLIDEENPDLTIIVLPDTLVKGDKLDLSSDSSADGYAVICKSVEDDLLKHEKGKELMRVTNGKLKILVEPGIGQFSTGYFRGNIMDFFHKTFRSLGEIVTDMLQGPFDGHSGEDPEELHIILDVTHGSNYTIILTTRAVRELAQLIATKYHVSLKIYNADPYFREKENRVPQRINIVENIPDMEHYLPDIHLADKALDSFWKAAKFGFPLLLIHQYPDVLSLKKKLDNLTVQFTRDIVLSRGSTELGVKTGVLVLDRKSQLGVEYWKLSLVYFLAKLHPQLHVMQQSVSSGTKLKDLYPYNPAFARIYSPLVSSYIETELDAIEKVIDKNRTSSKYRGWNKLLELFRGHDSQKQRHLFAHAGLLRSQTEFKVDTYKGNPTLLRYGEKAMKKLFKILTPEKKT